MLALGFSVFSKLNVPIKKKIRTFQRMRFVARIYRTFLDSPLNVNQGQKYY
jgi:hypothetical protein